MAVPFQRATKCRVASCVVQLLRFAGSLTNRELVSIIFRRRNAGPVGVRNDVTDLCQCVTGQIENLLRIRKKATNISNDIAHSVSNRANDFSKGTASGFLKAVWNPRYYVAYHRAGYFD